MLGSQVGARRRAGTFGRDVWSRGQDHNPAFRARISQGNDGIENRQAKRKRLTGFSADSYNLRFVFGMICGTVRGTSIPTTNYSKE